MKKSLVPTYVYGSGKIQHGQKPHQKGMLILQDKGIDARGFDHAVIYIFQQTKSLSCKKK